MGTISRVEYIWCLSEQVAEKYHKKERQDRRAICSDLLQVIWVNIQGCVQALVVGNGLSSDNMKCFVLGLDLNANDQISKVTSTVLHGVSIRNFVKLWIHFHTPDAGRVQL